FKRDNAGIDNEIDFLATVPIFESLSNRQKVKLFSIMYTRKYENGEVVFRQGDPGVGLYVLKKGVVDVFSEYQDNTCCKITSLSPGEFFGETSLLNESPRSATVIASSESTLLGLFKPELLSLMDSDPKLGLRLIYRLAQVVAERLRLINDQLG
ncbi:cyclic nucleotide-binding domain-containing protein, partial [Candidatus Latescibacterota bacterium]